MHGLAGVAVVVSAVADFGLPVLVAAASVGLLGGWGAALGSMAAGHAIMEVVLASTRAALGSMEAAGSTARLSLRAAAMAIEGQCMPAAFMDGLTIGAPSMEPDFMDGPSIGRSTAGLIGLGGVCRCTALGITAAVGGGV